MKELLYLDANCFLSVNVMADIQEKDFYKRIGKHILSIASMALLIVEMSISDR